MKRVWIFLIGCLLVPVYAGALTFVPGPWVESTNDSLRHILPRLDRQEESTAVLFIKTNILQVSVRGRVRGVPRRVNQGYVVFLPQGTDELQLNAPLYATQTIHFKPVEGGKYYEMRLTTKEGPQAIKAAARRAQKLDLNQTRVNLALDFDYMDVPAEVRKNRGALIYLDQTLHYDQWQQLLMPNGPYQPFDMSGNTKNPCCIVVPAGEPIENIFRMRRMEMDSYVEHLESGNTYHATLTLTPKN